MIDILLLLLALALIVALGIIRGGKAAEPQPTRSSELPAPSPKGTPTNEEVELGDKLLQAAEDRRFGQPNYGHVEYCTCNQEPTPEEIKQEYCNTCGGRIG